MKPLNEITSPDNPRLKLFRAVATGKRRDLVMVEGTRHCGDTIAITPPTVVLLTPELAGTPGGHQLTDALAKCIPAPDVCLVPAPLLKKVSAVEASQGIAMLLPRPQWQEDDIFSGGPLLLLCGVQDPGNVGALARSAHAAGCNGMLTLASGADPLSPKVVRASAGSTLRLPTMRLESANQAIALLQHHQIPIVGTDPAAGIDYRKAPIPASAALALGPEGGGLPPEIETAIELRVRIPMAQGVESLNVSVAGSLLLFELNRNRKDN